MFQKFEIENYNPHSAVPSLHARPRHRSPHQRHEEGRAETAAGRHRGRPHGDGSRGGARVPGAALAEQGSDSMGFKICLKLLKTCPK